MWDNCGLIKKLSKVQTYMVARFLFDFLLIKQMSYLLNKYVPFDSPLFQKMNG